MQITFKDIKRYLDEKKVAIDLNQKPPILIEGGYSSKSRNTTVVNKQVVVIIKEFKEGEAQMFSDRTEEQIKKTYRLDLNKRVPTWHLESKANALKILEDLSDYLSEPLNYDSVTLNKSINEHSVLTFALYLPIIETQYLT